MQVQFKTLCVVAAMAATAACSAKLAEQIIAQDGTVPPFPFPGSRQGKATPPLRLPEPKVPGVPGNEFRDSSVDALPDYRVPVVPDIVQAIVALDAGAAVFTLRLRPGSFDSAATRFAIDLDIDQNASTGSGGIEYMVFVLPENGRGAEVARMKGATYTVSGTIPVRFVADGCDVAIPLTLLGSDDGRFDFRVRVYAEPALPLVLDSLPDVGFARIK